jgi:HAMP domain-containing protein
MSIGNIVKRNLSVQITLKLAVPLALLLAGAGYVITRQATRQLEEATLEKARLTSTMAARQWGEMFDSAIDSGLLTISDVFDTNYVEIKGWNWGPKPKYHTRYDTLTDRMVLNWQDRILEQPEFVYAVGLDVNGYVPTHNGAQQRPLDGSERDLLENRTKRIYNTNDTERTRSKSLEPFLLQVYHRDTGETMWDASAPIFVKGKHWGAFVLGVSMKRLDARKQEVITTLVAAFTLFALVTLASIFLMVRQAMRPVVALTAAADQISLGEGLETPLKTDAIDEIGVLTKSIDRLRASMKAAMSRLGH